MKTGEAGPLQRWYGQLPISVIRHATVFHGLALSYSWLPSGTQEGYHSTWHHNQIHFIQERRESILLVFHFQEQETFPTCPIRLPFTSS